MTFQDLVALYCCRVQRDRQRVYSPGSVSLSEKLIYTVSFGWSSTVGNG